MVNNSNNDLRYVYNLIEVSYYATNDRHITMEVMKNISSKSSVYIDKNSDRFYVFPP